MKGRDVIILQARLDSSRLPGKALLPLADRTVIEHAMTALNGVPAGCRVLATDDAGARAFEPYARSCGFELFAGPKEDVLRRFSLAAEAFGASRIIRATGDNPLVSAALASRLLVAQEREGWDYGGFTGPPVGTGVEVVRAEALLEADRLAVEPYDREHVTPYLYHHPETYSVSLQRAPEEYCAPEMRVTLDTAEDYRSLQRIFADCYRGEPVEADTLVFRYGDSAREQGA